MTSNRVASNVANAIDGVIQRGVFQRRQRRIVSQVGQGVGRCPADFRNRAFVVKDSYY